MQPKGAHRLLAEKFLFKGTWDHDFLPDSLLELVRFVYSEEEAEIVTALGVAPLPARVVARKVRRPFSEVNPVLKGLAARNCIARIRVKGAPLYGFLPLAPGVFEAQMCQGKNDEYSRRFAELFEQVYTEMFTFLKPRMAKNDMRFGRIIPVERAIDASPGLGVLAYATDRYSELVERNRSFCIVHACSCRHEANLVGRGCGKPLDVCSAMGALADFCVDNGLARRVSREEFLEAKQRAAEAGLVNMTDNLRDPMQVCSCCGCCCGALRILTEFNIPGIITQSHFRAVVEETACVGCGACERICPMKAVRLNHGKAAVAPSRCIGCGVCILPCQGNGAIRLTERKPYHRPSETLGDFALSRYLEYKGYHTALAGRLTLGVGRLLNRIAPVHLSGPKYRKNG
jgi:Na+-translocating ferredoxin:NAD+ oxidoreductase subunit B